MKKNCCLIIGNFKNPHINDPFIQNKYSYINLLKNIDEKLIEPNNCDIFIYTSFNDEYEIFDKNNITLHKDNIKEFTNNIKKIFGKRLKYFNILNNNESHLNEQNILFEKYKINQIENNKNKNIKNFNEKKFLLNKMWFFHYKFYKIMQIISEYEKNNNLVYNKYIQTRPDISFSNELLINKYNSKNTIYCWYTTLLITDSKIIKHISKEILFNFKFEDNSGENILYNFFRKMNYKINSIYNNTFHYHRLRYMNNKNTYLHMYNKNDIKFLNE